MGVIYSRSRPIGSLTARRYARAVLVGSFAVPIVRGHPGIPRDWTPCSGPQRASRSRWQPPRDHPRVHRGARDAQDHVDHHLAHHHCVSGRGGECGANSAVMRRKADGNQGEVVARVIFHNLPREEGEFLLVKGGKALVGAMVG